VLRRHFVLALALGALAGRPTHATEVNVVGLFGGKAVVEIDRKPGRMLREGETTTEGVKLISANPREAVLEVDGKRRTVGLGESVGATYANASRPAVTLVANQVGHFITEGSINGASTRFLVDTGASTVALGWAEAKRLGINYSNGHRQTVSTANGLVQAYRVTLDNVTIGAITLRQVDAMVIDGPGSNITLLGMSFLKRVSMQREGETLTMVRQY
jgi:aspartyl protease family protein